MSRLALLATVAASAVAVVLIALTIYGIAERGDLSAWLLSAIAAALVVAVLTCPGSPE